MSFQRFRMIHHTRLVVDEDDIKRVENKKNIVIIKKLFIF